MCGWVCEKAGLKADGEKDENTHATEMRSSYASIFLKGLLLSVCGCLCVCARECATHSYSCLL